MWLAARLGSSPTTQTAESVPVVFSETAGGPPGLAPVACAPAADRAPENAVTVIAPSFPLSRKAAVTLAFDSALVA